MGVTVKRRGGSDTGRFVCLFPVGENRGARFACQVERSWRRALTQLASHHCSNIICLIVDKIVVGTVKTTRLRWGA
jgi:hypothetical protein